MPLRLEIKKKLNTRSDRVKSVDFHPNVPWVLSALYSGHLVIHDWEEQATVRTIEVCPNTAIRCAKFIARKQWVICGADDMAVRVFNYHSMEKVKQFDAHGDFIRHVAVHPTLPLVLTSSDDMSVRLWDWGKDWARVASFEGHLHYVMMSQWNPKDPHIFATASLDRTIKVWGAQTPGIATGGVVSQPHFSLVGHESGVNCIEYSSNGEKPYIVSGGDENTVRVWDYQTKQCVMVLTGHVGPLLSVAFHPYLPVIISGGEDGSCILWHSTTYRQETSLKYGMGRVWAVATTPSSNAVALATDEGTVVFKLGTERAIASMHGSKIVFAKGSDIGTANVKLIDDTLFSDGERLPLPVKDLGACEIFPQSLSHHPNGRLIAVCGDGEYVVYTAQALRSKAYGKAVDFGWSSEGHYAVRDESGRITIYQNFKEHVNFKPAFPVEEIFEGKLLGVRSSEFICFYDWQEFRLIRRIDVRPHAVYWNEEGTEVVLACQDSFFILRHDPGAVAAAITAALADSDQGIEAAFDLEREVNERIESALWISGCFAFTTARLRLHTITAGVVDTAAFLDRPSWLIGYSTDTNRLYLIDRELSVISYKLHHSLIEYRTAIALKQFETASQIFQKIPAELHNRVARFLESQGHLETALEVTRDLDHKFELGRMLGKLELCATVLREASKAAAPGVYKTQWKQLGNMGLEQGAFGLAIGCLKEAEDMAGLLLIHSSTGDAEGLRYVAQQATVLGQTHIAVTAYLFLHDIDKCIEVLLSVDRVPEAALFAKAYAPSRVSDVVKIWKTKLIDVKHKQVADTLADPTEMPSLFPGYEDAFKEEQIRRQGKSTTLLTPPVVVSTESSTPTFAAESVEDGDREVPVKEPSDLLETPDEVVHVPSVNNLRSIEGDVDEEGDLTESQDIHIEGEKEGKFVEEEPEEMSSTNQVPLTAASVEGTSQVEEVSVEGGDESDLLSANSDLL